MKLNGTNNGFHKNHTQKMIRSNLINFLFLIFPLVVLSQKNTISGVVTNTDGEPMIGVSIVIDETDIGTISNFDGEYLISTGSNVSGNLKFIFLGYATQTVEFDSNSSVINVVMEESANQLEEIVVTALGVKRSKKSLSYATQQVNTDDLTEARSTNFLNALSGKASGVQIVSSSTPTGSTRVVIRGLTSITGNNQPLYVVDGIPLDSSVGDGGVSVWNGNAESGDIDYGSPISTINPDDIDSIQVLKGANASALYGSRASNGVVLITTKKASGEDAKIRVNVNTNFSVTSNREYPKNQYIYGPGAGGRIAQNAQRLDAETGLPIIGSQRRAYGLPLLGQEVFDFNGTIGLYLPNTNNIKDFYRTGTVHTNTFAISRVKNESSLRLSYSNTIGDHVIQRMEELNRNNIALRYAQNFNEKLKLNSTFICVNQVVDNRMFQNGSERNPAANYIYMMPNMSETNLLPYKDSDGNAFNYEGPFNNPYWNLFENTNQDITDRIVANISLDWEILEGLNLKAKINGSLNEVDKFVFNNPGAAYDPDGLYREINSERQNWNFEATLNYTAKSEDFSLVSLLGVNRFDFSLDGLNRTAIALNEKDVMNFSNAVSFLPDVILNNNKRINAVFASASVGFDDTYYLDLTARNDWSSTLPSDNNSYFYPSIGGAFVFSNLVPVSNFLTFGKLRGSWAQVGSDAPFDRILNNYIIGGNYNNTNWLALQTSKGNPDLKPELTSSLEFGLEAKLFNNKLSIDASYYRSSTNNQIIPAIVSPTSGFISNIVNAGEIENSGFEVFMSAKILDKRFKWQTDINWSTNESTVLSLIDGVDQLQIRNWLNVGVFAEVGQPFGNIRGNAIAKDPETGTLLVLETGRAVWDSNQLLGNAQPDWIGSLRNSFVFKNFSLNVLLDVKYGGDLYSATMLRSVNHGVHAETLQGREEFFFSNVVLGEGGVERRGSNILRNGDYADADRAKGRTYQNAALGVLDDNGNWVAQRDENGNIIYSNRWISPDEYGYDGLQDQQRYVYDASYVKLREITFGYTFPGNLIKNTVFKNVKISVVGRDLWTIYRNTPQGIDPEAGTTSGNGQGIEFGSFLPTRTVGINVNLVF